MKNKSILYFLPLCFILLSSFVIYQRNNLTNEKNSISVSQRPQLNKAFFPITVNVDATSPITVLGQNCTAHVTGTITLEITLLPPTIGLTGQDLSISIECKKKKAPVNVARLYSDEHNYCYDLDFESTGDNEIDLAISDTNLKSLILQQINEIIANGE